MRFKINCVAWVRIFSKRYGREVRNTCVKKSGSNFYKMMQEFCIISIADRVCFFQGNHELWEMLSEGSAGPKSTCCFRIVLCIVKQNGKHNAGKLAFLLFVCVFLLKIGKGTREVTQSIQFILNCLIWIKVVCDIFME